MSSSISQCRTCGKANQLAAVAKFGKHMRPTCAGCVLGENSQTVLKEALTTPHFCMADRSLLLLVSLGGAVQKTPRSSYPPLLTAGAACLCRTSGPQMCSTCNLRVVVQSKAREYSGSPQTPLWAPAIILHK